MPNLDLRALETRVKTGKLERLYVFHGEDVKLIDRMVDAVEATVEAGDRPFAVEHIYAGEAGGSPVDIAAAARSLPMLGDRRIVVVLRAERFLKPKRASKTAEVEEPDDEEPSGDALDLVPLEEYIQKPAESSTVVFVAAGVDRGRRFTKQLLERAHVTEFGGLSGDPAARGAGRAAITEQINRELGERQRKIEPRILHELVERSGADVSRLRDEVDRLLLFTEGQSTVSIEDVREVAPEHAVVTNEWAVTDALSAGDAAKALRELAIKLDRGDSPHAVLGQLRWWVSSRLAEGEGGRVRPAIEAVKRTDLALKSSGGDDRALLERLIVELAGRPLARTGGGWGGRR